MARLDTFAGRPDTLGAGMAVVVDAVLARGFTTDGFEQGDGYPRVPIQEEVSGVSGNGARIVGGTGYLDYRNGMWVPVEAVV